MLEKEPKEEEVITRRLPTREKIVEKATELYMKDHPEATTNPEVYELSEGGYLVKARNRLMTSLVKQWKSHKNQHDMNEEEQEKYWRQSEYKKYKPILDESSWTDISIDKIIPCPILPKREMGELDIFTASLEFPGLIKGIVVKESKTETGYFELISGYRTVEAAKRSEFLTELHAHVYAEDLPAKLVFMIANDENKVRKDLTVAERAIFYEKWKKSENIKRWKDLARLARIEPSEMSHYKTIIDLRNEYDCVKKLNRFKFLTLNKASLLNSIKEDKKLLERACEIFDKNPKMSDRTFYRKVMEKKMRKKAKKEIALGIHPFYVEQIEDVIEDIYELYGEKFTVEDFARRCMIYGLSKWQELTNLIIQDRYFSYEALP